MKILFTDKRRWFIEGTEIYFSITETSGFIFLIMEGGEEWGFIKQSFLSFASFLGFQTSGQNIAFLGAWPPDNPYQIYLYAKSIEEFKELVTLFAETFTEEKENDKTRTKSTIESSQITT